MKAIISRLYIDEKLLAQFFLVFAAFFIMATTSSYYGARIVSKTVASYGDEAISSSVETINLYLGEYTTTLKDVGYAIESLKDEGADVEALHAELARWTTWVLGRDSDTGFLSIYCEMDGEMFDGQYAEPPEGYVPESRPWHIGAVAENGGIHYCDPYVDIRTGNYVLTISKRLIGADGKPFGVIAIDLYITTITDYVESLKIMQSGYGILLVSDRTIAVHPNKSLIGTRIDDVGGSYAEMASELAKGNDLSAFTYTDYQGRKNVVFYRKLLNGWHVGIVSPRSAYYNDVYNMVLLLSAMGLTLGTILCVLLVVVNIEKNRSHHANQLKTSFLARISHEIRTPLNAMLGMSELLQNERLNERQISYVNDINNSARSLLEIVNDILNFSEIDAGKLQLHPVNYNFQMFLDNLRSMFRFAAEQKGLDFGFEIVGDVPEYLFGDEAKLRHAMTNICGNSIKFTQEGRVDITVSCDQDTITFEVEDTGRGIRKEEVQMLFSPFTQTDTQMNRNLKGVGLGLSISKSFIEMMGGCIAVESVYGEGSVFTVTIPWAEGTKEEADAVEEHKDQLFNAPKAKILVVDDNEVNLKVAAGLLKKLYNIDALTVLSGLEALDAVMNNEFDLVFMDHMMPEMDGVETTREIRKLGGKCKNLKIVALTANTIPGAKEMFLSNGFNGFLAKPIVTHQMTDTLREMLPDWKFEERVDEPLESDMANTEDLGGSIVEKLRAISGINVEVGLSRVSGIEEMYCETTALFFKKLPAECAKMNEFLDNGSVDNLAISVHGMKSSLSTIGAMELSDVAYDLEKASKNGDVSYCEDRFPVFLADLRVLHEQLALVFPDTTDAQKSSQGNAEDLKNAVRRALAEIENFDSDSAIEALNCISEYDFGASENKLIEDAANALSEFDFDTAAELLTSLTGA